MNPISRRDFLKVSMLGLGALAFTGKQPLISRVMPDFPQGVKLGRAFGSLDIKSKPNPDSTTVKSVYEDTVVEWDREVIGSAPSLYSTNRRWVETPDGYVPLIAVQPVQAILNTPVAAIPQQPNGESGFWGEITVPYVDATLEAPAKTPKIEGQTTARFYYSQIYWVDQVKTASDGSIQYRFYEKHGGYGDLFWADASAFHQITADESSPLSPGVADKKIIVDITHQTVSCYEGKSEVMFTRMSSGAKDIYGNYVDKWATPVGDYNVINRKFISIHMAGGTSASGYEEFSVCWTSMFTAEGIALHSTYWHNNYGEPMSHGCVNLMPDDAKFIYRWSLPSAPYAEGKIEQSGYDGTNVQVKQEPF
jgi:lipoprotein-anchoring transpeptidase ErfK/SrfK